MPSNIQKAIDRQGMINTELQFRGWSTLAKQQFQNDPEGYRAAANKQIADIGAGLSQGDRTRFGGRLNELSQIDEQEIATNMNAQIEALGRSQNAQARDSLRKGLSQAAEEGDVVDAEAMGGALVQMANDGAITGELSEMQRDALVQESIDLYGFATQNSEAYEKVFGGEFLDSSRFNIEEFKDLPPFTRKQILKQIDTKGRLEEQELQQYLAEQDDLMEDITKDYLLGRIDEDSYLLTMNKYQMDNPIANRLNGFFDKPSLNPNDKLYGKGITDYSRFLATGKSPDMEDGSPSTDKYSYLNPNINMEEASIFAAMERMGLTNEPAFKLYQKELVQDYVEDSPYINVFAARDLDFYKGAVAIMADPTFADLSARDKRIAFKEAFDLAESKANAVITESEEAFEMMIKPERALSDEEMSDIGELHNIMLVSGTPENEEAFRKITALHNKGKMQVEAVKNAEIDEWWEAGNADPYSLNEGGATAKADVDNAKAIWGKILKDWGASKILPEPQALLLPQTRRAFGLEAEVNEGSLLRGLTLAFASSGELIQMAIGAGADKLGFEETADKAFDSASQTRQSIDEIQAKNTTVTDNLASVGSALVGGWAGVARGTGAALGAAGVALNAKKGFSAAKAIKTMGDVAIADAIVFDSEEQNIARWMNDEFEIDVWDWIMTTPGASLRNRGIRAFTDSILIDAGLAVGVLGRNFIRALRRGEKVSDVAKLEGVLLPDDAVEAIPDTPEPSTTAKIDDKKPVISEKPVKDKDTGKGKDGGKDGDKGKQDDKGTDGLSDEKSPESKVEGKADEVVDDGVLGPRGEQYRASIEKYLENKMLVIGAKKWLKGFSDSWTARKEAINNNDPFARSSTSVINRIMAQQESPSYRLENGIEYYQPNGIGDLNAAHGRKSLPELDDDPVRIDRDALEGTLEDNTGFNKVTAENVLRNLLNNPDKVYRYEDGRLKYVIVAPQSSTSYSVTLKRSDDNQFWTASKISFVDDDLPKAKSVFDKVKMHKTDINTDRGRLNVLASASRRLKKFQGWANKWDEGKRNAIKNSGLKAEYFDKTMPSYYRRKFQSIINGYQNILVDYGDTRGLMLPDEVLDARKKLDTLDFEVFELIQWSKGGKTALERTAEKQALIKATKDKGKGKGKGKGKAKDKDTGEVEEVVDDYSELTKLTANPKKALAKDHKWRDEWNMWRWDNGYANKASITKAYGGKPPQKHKTFTAMFHGRLAPGDQYYGEVRDALDGKAPIGYFLGDSTTAHGTNRATRKEQDRLGKLAKRKAKMGGRKSLSDVDIEGLPAEIQLLVRGELVDGRWHVDPDKVLDMISHEAEHGYNKYMYEVELKENGSEVGDFWDKFDDLTMQENLEGANGFPAMSEYDSFVDYIKARDSYISADDKLMQGVADVVAMDRRLSQEEFYGVLAINDELRDNAREIMGEVWHPEDVAKRLDESTSAALRNAEADYRQLKGEQEAFAFELLSDALPELEAGGVKTFNDFIKVVSDSISSKPRLRKDLETRIAQGDDVMAAMFTTLRDKFDFEALPKATNDDLALLAYEVYGGNVLKLVEGFNKADGNKAGMVLLARATMKAIGKDARDKAIKIAFDHKGKPIEINDRQRNEMAGHFVAVPLLAQKIRATLSESGRVLQTGRENVKTTIGEKLVGENYQQQFLAVRNPKYGGANRMTEPEHFDAAIRELAAITGDGDEAVGVMNRAVNEAIDAGNTGHDVAIELFIVNILTSIKTLGINITSNIAKLGIKSAEMGVQGVLTDLMRMSGWQVQGGATTKDVYYFWRDIINNTGKFMAMAKHAYKVGRTSWGGSGVERPNIGVKFREDKTEAAKIMRSMRFHQVSHIFSYVGTRPLTFMDEAMKLGTYDAGLNMNARRLAQIAQQLNPNDKDIYNKIYHEASTYPTVASMQKAMDFGDEITATSPLPRGLQSIIDYTNRNFFAKLVIPFFRSIFNDAKFSAKRTPLMLFSREFREDIVAGGDRTTKAIAEISTAGLMFVAYMQARQLGAVTQTTGDWHKDMTEAIVKGQPPGSVSTPVGDYDMSRLEPVGVIYDIYNFGYEAVEGFMDIIFNLSTTKELSQQEQMELMYMGSAMMHHLGQKGDKDFIDNMAKHVDVLVNRFLDRTGGSGLKGAGKLINNTESNIKKYAEKFPSRFSPSFFSSYGTAFGLRPHLKEYYSKEHEWYENTLGFLLNKFAWGVLPDKHDYFGEKVLSNSGPTSAIGGMTWRDYSDDEKAVAAFYSVQGRQIPASVKKWTINKKVEHLSAREYSAFSSIRAMPVFNIPTKSDGSDTLRKAGVKQLDRHGTFAEVMAHTIKTMRDSDLSGEEQAAAIYAIKESLNYQQKAIFYSMPEGIRLNSLYGASGKPIPIINDYTGTDEHIGYAL